MTDINPGQSDNPNDPEQNDPEQNDPEQEEPDPVRVIVVGVIGPPERWQPLYSVVDNVCRSMCFPFSPDQPETDQNLYANVVEYASTATDLQGDLIAGQPTVVFTLPGIDRTRRMGIVAEAIPRSLVHHRVYGNILYFGKDMDEEMSTGLVEAMARGFQTWSVGEDLSDLNEEMLATRLSQWMTGLDPQADSLEEGEAQPVTVF